VSRESGVVSAYSLAGPTAVNYREYEHEFSGHASLIARIKWANPRQIADVSIL